MRSPSSLTLAIVLSTGIAPAKGQSAPLPCARGYRIHGELRDRTLGRNWTVLASCGHPEAPWIAVEGGPGTPPPTVGAGRLISRPTPIPVQTIMAGDKVTVWKQGAQVRVVLAGIAIESRQVGAAVRVRIPSRGIVVSGIARANASVEWTGPEQAQWQEREP